jgi:hypothetical protein
VPVVRALLVETTELRGAVQVLAQRVDELTAELAVGELSELRRVLAARLSGLTPAHPAHNGGGR